MIFLKEIDIDYAEKLSGIELAEEDRIKTKKDLQYILSMAEEIFEADTEGVAETYSVAFEIEDGENKC